MTPAIRIRTAPPTQSSQERWIAPATVPIGSTIDAHLDCVLALDPAEVAPPRPAATVSRARVPRIPRWNRFEPAIDRVVPTYLAFESSERLNEYLTARTLLADRTR